MPKGIYQRKPRIADLDQVDGKDRSETTAATLDLLLGAESGGPYNTADAEEYDNYINSLNSTDLDRHAQKVGLMPTHDRRILKDRLRREFLKFVLSRRPISAELAQSHMYQDSSGAALDPVVQKILREGA